VNIDQAEKLKILQVLPHERGNGIWSFIAALIFFASVPVALVFGPLWGIYLVMVAILFRLQQ
jgi:hypothetical protein